MSGPSVTRRDVLKGAGYATAHIGKWHLGDPRVHADLHPMSHGFDRYFGLPYSNDMDPLPLYDDRTIVEEPPDQASLTRRYSEQSLAFVREHADEPFFLCVAQTQPHEPLASEFAGRSAGGSHGDSVEEIDHYVGVLLKELTALGIRDRTCFIFTSDNGPWFVGSSGDLYGRKAETYEGGILRALAGRRRVDRGDIFYYDDSAPDGHCNAVRRGDWTLHVNRVPGPYFTSRQFSATEQLPQLFNLRRDPEESYDLGEHHPAIVETLSARIAEFDAALRADQRDRYGTSG